MLYCNCTAPNMANPGVNFYLIDFDVGLIFDVLQLYYIKTCFFWPGGAGVVQGQVRKILQNTDNLFTLEMHLHKKKDMQFFCKYHFN